MPHVLFEHKKSRSQDHLTKFSGFARSHERGPNPKHEIRNPKQYLMIKIQMIQRTSRCLHKCFVFVIRTFVIWACFEFRYSDFGFYP